MSLKSYQWLKRFCYDSRYQIDKVKIWYIDRGSKDVLNGEEIQDVSSINGSALCSTNDKFFFEVASSCGDTKQIPYHRIVRIEYDGKCLFKRLMVSAEIQNKVLGESFLHDQKVKRMGLNYDS